MNHLTDKHDLSFLLRVDVLLIFLAAFLVHLIANAWINDDAYITFRTIDNFINGYGLRWNVDERVQSYTNPLWMLLLSAFYFITQEIYFTSLIISISLSLLTVYLIAFKVAAARFSALLALIICISSNAFMHYSASGLENPLTNLLIVLFAWVYLKHYAKPDGSKGSTIFLLAFIAGLSTLNRMDSLLMYLPVLLWILWQQRAWNTIWRTIGLMVVGFMPFMLWEVFALIYYGFLFPNTAYAKLGGGIEHYKLIIQGVVYLVESLFRDPITLFTIATACLVPLWTRQSYLWPLVLGMALTVAYVINVGGDFMSGRFLAAPLVGAVILVSQLTWPTGQTTLSKLKNRLSMLIIVLATLSAVDYLSPINWIEKPYETIRAQVLKQFSSHFLYVKMPLEARIQQLGKENRPVIFNISHEQVIYYPMTGLWLALNGVDAPEIHYWAIEGSMARHQQLPVAVKGAVGFYGFYAGPEVHIIDIFALCDPLLARLPPSKIWRVGHLERSLPAGYFESIQQDKNLLVDAELSVLYDQLRLVTRGDLFDPERWRVILLLNFGIGR